MLWFQCGSRFFVGGDDTFNRWNDLKDVKDLSTSSTPEEKFIIDLFQWGKKEKVKEIDANYEKDSNSGKYVIKEIKIKNKPYWQCWFCNGSLQQGSSYCTNRNCENNQERERERESKIGAIPTSPRKADAENAVEMII